MRLMLAIILFTLGQIVAWFQSNSVLLGKSLSENYILISLILGPITALLFAHGTKLMYQEVESLWIIRFLGFSIGYIIFIPLTWYFLGEPIITLKNVISFLLCCSLMAVQFLIK